MKKLVIIGVLVLFVLYCISSARNYGSMPIPRYSEIEIDVMNGMSGSAWRKDPTAQQDRLKELGRAAYQPPKNGWAFGDGLVFTPLHVLTADDYRKILNSFPENARELTVRDPSSLLAMADKGYFVRDNMGRDGEVLVERGQPVTKQVLDRLLDAGFSKIRVTGRGSMVSPEPGTMLMVVLIFLGLYCALRVVLFDPLIKIIDERESEVEEGYVLARQNRQMEVDLAESFSFRRKEMHRLHLAELAKARHAVMREADGILKEAQVESHRIRDNAHMQMKESLAEAEKALAAEVDEIAKEIVAQVMPVPGGRK